MRSRMNYFQRAYTVPLSRGRRYAHTNIPETIPSLSNPTLFAFMGIPGCGKSTSAEELAKKLYIPAYCEPEEDQFPSDIPPISVSKNKYGNFITFNNFRKLRIPYLIAMANSKMGNNSSSIIDSYYDKLAYDILIQGGMKFITEPECNEYQNIMAVAEVDRKTLPNVDVLVFLTVSLSILKAFRNKRNRDYEPQISIFLEQDLFREVAKNWARAEGKHFIDIEQQNSNPKETIDSIMAELKNRGIISDSNNQQRQLQIRPTVVMHDRFKKIFNIHTIYTKLARNNSLNSEDIDSLEMNLQQYTEAQYASLWMKLYLKEDKNQIEIALMKRITRDFKLIRKYATLLEETFTNDCKNLSPTLDILLHENQFLIQAITMTILGESISDGIISVILNRYRRDLIDDVFMAMWLAAITKYQISKDNINEMTLAMSSSGKTFDYRNKPELEYRKIIRRYPTGGLSEKIALIMPSLISCFSKEYQIASNFLIAKTLSYTGGTWDKLNAIPGFQFPRQGSEAMAIMKKCGVAMSVTNEGFNPLDSKLYQLRGVTGTTESPALVITSIASKLLALPADAFLLDVRYGDAAFATTMEDAVHLGESIAEIISRSYPCDYSLTEMKQPNGNAIGNHLEVIEAICLMKNDDLAGLWSKAAFEEQKELVVDMFSRLMNKLYPNINLSTWQELSKEKFSNGSVLKAFSHLLISHGVDENVCEKLIEAPLSILPENMVSVSIPIYESGKLSYIDQKSLGYFVNSNLNTGLNQYVLKKELNGYGIILHKRLGDTIKFAEPVCTVYLDSSSTYAKNYKNQLIKTLSSCFACQ